MPKAPSTTTNPSSSESKPYVQPDGTALPTNPRKKPSKSASSSPAKPQGWTLEDKQTLLFAVLATAKPDFNAIAKEKFGDKGRNANQVRIQGRGFFSSTAIAHVKLFSWVIVAIGLLSMEASLESECFLLRGKSESESR